MTLRMMNTHEAKTRLSELIRMVEAGDEVILARNGKAVAKLIAWPERRPLRRLGAWRGQIHHVDDIVGSDPDIVAMFDEASDR